jgi:hypothetical protein
MTQGMRSKVSPTERTDIWNRWKTGQSLHEIGRAHGKPHSSIRCFLLLREGIPPAARRRSRLALTLLGERIYHEGSPLARRFVRLLDDWIERPRR